MMRTNVMPVLNGEHIRLNGEHIRLNDEHSTLTGELTRV